MKIVVLDGYTENPGDLSWEGFWQFGEVTVYDRTEEEEIINRIGDAQAVITNKTPITRETLNACPDIQYIGVLATGYNVVDTDAAKREESLSAISPPMGPRPWGSLPLPFCWKSAIISGITIRRCMTDAGRIVPTGVSGITL